MRTLDDQINAVHIAAQQIGDDIDQAHSDDEKDALKLRRQALYAAMDSLEKLKALQLAYIDVSEILL